MLNQLLNGDVDLMVQEHCVMPVVYVFSHLTLIVNILLLDYAKVHKKSQGEHTRPDGMSNGHLQENHRQ